MCAGKAGREVERARDRRSDHKGTTRLKEFCAGWARSCTTRGSASRRRQGQTSHKHRQRMELRTGMAASTRSLASRSAFCERLAVAWNAWRYVSRTGSSRFRCRRAERSGVKRLKAGQGQLIAISREKRTPGQIADALSNRKVSDPIGGVSLFAPWGKAGVKRDEEVRRGRMLLDPAPRRVSVRDVC